MAVQWLGVCTSIAGGLGSIPAVGTKILQATRSKTNKQKIKQKKTQQQKDSIMVISGGTGQFRRHITVYLFVLLLCLNHVTALPFQKINIINFQVHMPYI